MNKMQLLPSTPAFENSAWSAEALCHGCREKMELPALELRGENIRASSGFSIGRYTYHPSTHTDSLPRKREIKDRPICQEACWPPPPQLLSSPQNPQQTGFLYPPNKCLLIAGCMNLILGVQCLVYDIPWLSYINE